MDSSDHGDTQEFSVTEASIAATREALEQGSITSTGLIHAFLNRIGRYDRQGTRLNSIPILNPEAFREAADSDERRSRGESLGPLDGIPYTAKDSYKVRGLTVAAGSPAFEDLIAGDDAFVIERLRAGGAILLGLTNMPPMAAGGMQRGVYGRAESPYNPDFLCSAYGSGSSNGSGTATTSSFASFGLGEETWSSGRAPASNSSLVAYTPSRGMISMRGNWPLYPTMDVVVPHTRSVADLLEVLNVIVADDLESGGDFWRAQPWVDLPKASEVRPDDYRELPGTQPLAGKRLGVPRMYINRDPDSNNPIDTRGSVIALWQSARKALENLGAEVVETGFPAVSNYEEDRPGAESMYTRGVVPPSFLLTEMRELCVWAWNGFLEQNGGSAVRSLDDIDARKIFPLLPGMIPDHYEDDPDLADLAEFARGKGIGFDEIPELGESVRGLEEIRRADFEDWLTEEKMDGIVFPTAADVGPFDADFNPSSNERAWKNGVVYSNGNLAIRHLGIPTVTVPMGLMCDIAMPVGLTFAGRAYEDSKLLAIAAEFDQAHSARVVPPRTPSIPADVIKSGSGVPTAENRVGQGPGQAFTLDLTAEASPMADDGNIVVSVRLAAKSTGQKIESVEVCVNGEPIEMTPDSSHAVGSENSWVGSTALPAATHYAIHSAWRAPYGSLISAIAHGSFGSTAGSFTTIGGI